MAGAVIRPIMTNATQAAVLEDAGRFSPSGGVCARAEDGAASRNVMSNDKESLRQMNQIPRRYAARNDTLGDQFTAQRLILFHQLIFGADSATTSGATSATGSSFTDGAACTIFTTLPPTTSP